MSQYEKGGHFLLDSGRFVPLIPDHSRGDNLFRTHLKRKRNSTPSDSPDKQPPASFLNGNPIAQIEQAHVVFSEPPTNGSEPTNGKRYIKHPELTHPPMI